MKLQKDYSIKIQFKIKRFIVNLFAIGFVVIAGAMWAGSGLAAEHFLMHNPHTAMDLTVFRMLATAEL